MTVKDREHISYKKEFNRLRRKPKQSKPNKNNLVAVLNYEWHGRGERGTAV